ncbi:O-antigen ligase family protein [Clostridium aciditolerans]|uniref:O-antigen ligase family protein n=1 Tax=Clostridium aciditolerans TaxID=339861 RepID=A0A934HYI0_9CLOT|nr:O-antigen ligase family protein [Clostridium aciditolerans]MBI6873579.1 O-antigen ligase family protein [Clostridium aciditolerans]
MYDDMYKDLYGEEYEGNWYSVIPLIFLVSLVPLIVYGKAMKLTGDYFKYWNGSSQSLDFFSYYKGIWIMVFTIIALIILGVKLVSKEIKIHKNTIYIPMIIYSILIVLSTVFSDFKGISIWGFVERYEGMIVLLCYMLILFTTINIVKDKAAIKVILIALICSALIIGTIGILQYFGHDIFKTMTGKKLILPSQLQNRAANLKFQFGDKMIYATLYHYNYVGSYMAMLFPLTFTLFILIKNKFYKSIMALVSLLMFLNLILCHSRAGIIGGIIAILILITTLRKYFIENWKLTAAILVVALIGGVGFNIYSKGMLKARIGSLFEDAESLAKASNTSLLRDVVEKDKSLQIVFSDKTLKIQSDNDNIIFKDDKDNIINTERNVQSGQVVLKEDKFKDLIIDMEEYSTSTGKKYTMNITRGSLKIPLIINSGHFSFVNEYGDSLEIKAAEKWGLEGKEKLGSARGYIWSRSIPLLKHTVILGYGPDTFAAKFPQDDYVGKLVAYDTVSMLVDKAHNLYLENAINIGVLGLISFLAMFVIYFMSCAKLYFKNEFNDFYSIVGLAIFIAICGYLGAGFFNDSVVSVAPVFWVLFGMGVSVNYKLKNNRIDKENVN